MTVSKTTHTWVVCFLLLMGLIGCTSSTATPTTELSDNAEAVLTIPSLNGITVADGEKLRVVVTTSIIGDVVRNIAGDNIELTVLMSQGQDPHSYQPTPRDLATATHAHIVFVNGWDLEEGLIADLANAVDNGRIVPVSAGIPPLSGEDTQPVEEPHAYDPHVWFDPRNVMSWSDTIAEVLSTLDPANAATYSANAARYKAELATLDTYIREEVATIPEGNRKLVTNHDTFGYFAHAYGFEVIGTVLPGVSTGTEPSAADLTNLINAIEATGVQAVFIENTVGEGLADVVAEETGATVYELYTDALGTPGNGADTYSSMMRTDVDTLVEGLSQ